MHAYPPRRSDLLAGRAIRGPIFAIHDLCRALATRGHEVHVFTTNVDGPGISSVPIEIPASLDGVQLQ